MPKREDCLIRLDYKRICECAAGPESPISFTQIGNLLGLTMSEINTSLFKYPRSKEWILAKLEQNRLERIRTQQKTLQEFALEVIREVSKELAWESAKEAALEFAQEAVQNATLNIANELAPKIAEQIAHHKGEERVSPEYCNYIETKLLAEMEKEGVNDLLTPYFRPTLTNHLTTSNSIVVMHTMAAKIKRKGCETKGVEQETTKPAIQPKVFNQRVSKIRRMCGTQAKVESHKILTLFDAPIIDGKLSISVFSDVFKSICLFSGGKMHWRGNYELKLGDYIYLATKKKEFMTFAVYKIISLTEKNNSEMYFSARIYEENDIENLPMWQYRRFMRNFFSRIDK